MKTRTSIPDALDGENPRPLSTLLQAGILVGFGAFLTLPALTSGYIPSRDVLIHLLWSSNFSDQLWSGELYPRWLNGMNAGLGSPAFFFYGPLPYYLTALLRPLLGADAEGWRQVTTAAALAVILSGLVAYLWLKSFTNTTAALVAALLYMSSPYHLAFDLYERFAFGELWAFVWMPLIMLMAQRLGEARRGSLLGLALAYAALLLTHLPTAMIFSPVVLCHVILLSAKGRRLANLRDTLASMVLGAGLAAVYLAPALTTQDNVSFGTMKDGYFFYGYNFLYHGPRFNADFEALVRSQGMFSAVMAGLSIVAWAAARRRQGQLARQAALVWLLVAAGAWLMMIPPAKPLWDLLPPLQAIQFPWRFNVVLTLAMTALIALWVGALAGRPSRLQTALVLAACLTIIGQALPTLVRYLAIAASSGTPTIDTMLQRLGPLHPDAKTKFEAAKLSIDVPEYRPRWAPIEAFESAAGLNAFLEATRGVELGDAPRADCPAARCSQFTSGATMPTWVTVRRFYYPGWEARLVEDPAALPVRPSAGGLLQVLLPAGAHRVILFLASSRAERVGQAISLLSVIIASLFAAALLRSRPSLQ